MSAEPVLIAGQWRASAGSDTFSATNPTTGETLPHVFPVTPAEDGDAALDAAWAAWQVVRDWPGERFADFLEAFADAIEANTDAIVQAAHEETGLPISPRLKDGELPRTTGQLRQAAAAARDGSWREATIDTASGIRSRLSSVGPVVVFGPNNFPFAFNGVSGGDFAAAVAAGNPVIAKGHSAHPRTSQLLAQAAHEAAQKTGMPPGFVQMIYRLDHMNGLALVSDKRVKGVGYTGGRGAGLRVKAAADQAGIPVYLELSSINPVVILPGALKERASDIAGEYAGSCLMGTGQFCTNPGLVLLLDSPEASAFIDDVVSRFGAAEPGTLLAPGVRKGLEDAITTLTDFGADVKTGGKPVSGGRVAFENTILTATGAQFLEDPESLQTEAFGNVGLIVTASDVDQLVEILKHLEGNLTGCVYSDTGGSDDDAYTQIEPELRCRVGRLLNDKMPTGVAVVDSMNHGGPYPATGHPLFTAVGLPSSIRRFAMLQSYDNVRPERLPVELRDENPTGSMFRRIDGQWTQAGVNS